MKIFGQEGLGRPDQEVRSSLSEMENYIKKRVDAEELQALPDPRAVLVFLHPKAVVDAADAHIPTLHVDKLKDFMRRQAKEQPFQLNAMRQLQEMLPAETIN